MNYGFAPAFGPYAGAPFGAANLAPYGAQGVAVFGADPAPAPQTFWDKTKATLAAQNSVVPVKNGYLLGGGVALALVIYGSYEGWFGGRRR